MANPPRDGNFTDLLQRWHGGDQSALEELTPLVYRELHRIAQRHLARESPNHTLQPTALVHESFLKLVQQNVAWKNRAHFFNLAATLMRRILVDHARASGRLKRGAGAPTVSIADAAQVSKDGSLELADILMLDRALDELKALDPRQSRIVELRFFAGLTVEETAEALELSTGTVKREWTVARAWLFRRLAGPEQP